MNKDELDRKLALAKIGRKAVGGLIGEISYRQEVQRISEETEIKLIKLVSILNTDGQKFIETVKEYVKLTDYYLNYIPYLQCLYEDFVSGEETPSRYMEALQCEINFIKGTNNEQR